MLSINYGTHVRWISCFNPKASLKTINKNTQFIRAIDFLRYLILVECLTVLDVIMCNVTLRKTNMSQCQIVIFYQIHFILHVSSENLSKNKQFAQNPLKKTKFNPPLHNREVMTNLTALKSHDKNSRIFQVKCRLCLDRAEMRWQKRMRLQAASCCKICSAL